MNAVDAKSAPGVSSAPSSPGDAVAQMRRFLELGAAQLDAAIRESDARVNELATAVSGVAADARALQQVVHTLESQDAAAVQFGRQRVRELTQTLSAHADATITALQFYDKLIQRLTHVRDGLVMPSDSAASKPAAVDWNELLEQVRARYSTVEERVLFDFMMRGLNSDQMVKALSGLRASTAAGEFEAF